jgi:membrane-anchored glycerophosphoryl diester phosphodiesterase (GDPDase)
MHKFSISEAIKFGWNTTKKNFSFLIKVMLIMTVVYLLGGMVQNSAKDAAGLDFIINILVWILHTILDIGLVKIALKLVSNQVPSLDDLYNHYPLFWKYLGGSILTFLIVLGGIILLIIPGVIFGIRLQFVSYLIIDKGMGPIEAIKKSWQVTRGNTIRLLFFGLTLAGINILGALALLVGLLWTIPTSTLASAHVYKKLTQ